MGGLQVWKELQFSGRCRRHGLCLSLELVAVLGVALIYLAGKQVRAFSPAVTITAMNAYQGPKQVLVSSHGQGPMALQLVVTDGDIIRASGFTDNLVAVQASISMADEIGTSLPGDSISVGSNDPLVLVALAVALFSLVAVLVMGGDSSPPKVMAFDEDVERSADEAVLGKSNFVETDKSKMNTVTQEEREVEEREVAEDVLAFGGNSNDDLTVVGREAVEAFKSQDRKSLRKVISGLVGSLRSARNDLRSERVLREEAEANLKVAGERFRDLEDQYELEQNQLQKTKKTLETTQTQLSAATKKLYTTTETLEELQEERKSLRKLGRVAWNLSKDRFKNRYQKIRDRLRRTDDEPAASTPDESSIES